MHRIRRTMMMIILSVFLSFILLALQPQGALALEEVTVSYPGPSIFFLPAEIAKQRGFFRKQDLDVKLVVIRTEADRAALTSGDLDFSLRVSSTFVAAARGLPLRVIFISTQKPSWALVARPEVNSVKDLKGKAMAVPGLFGGQHITSRAILKQNGLDPDSDVVFRVVQSGSRIAGMQARLIDASLMNYDEAFRAKKAGFKILLNAADYYSVLGSGASANIKKIREQPDQVKRFLKGMVQALAYMRADREGTQEVMMNWLKVDREMAEAIYQLSINNYTKDGSLDETAMKPLVESLLAEAKIEGVTVAKLVDFTLLNQVLRGK